MIKRVFGAISICFAYGCSPHSEDVETNYKFHAGVDLANSIHNALPPGATIKGKSTLECTLSQKQRRCHTTLVIESWPTTAVPPEELLPSLIKERVARCKTTQCDAQNGAYERVDEVWIQVTKAPTLVVVTPDTH